MARYRHALRVSLAGFTALAAAACAGSSESPSVTPTAPPPETFDEAGPPDALLTPEPLQTAEPATPLEVDESGNYPAPSQWVQWENFVTPSGNIACTVDGHQARCDILDYTYTPPSAGECDLAWGQALYVEFEESGFMCAGDTVFGSYPILDYDQGTQIGKTICASETSGVTCFHNLTGSGFFLSREAYRIF